MGFVKSPQELSQRAEMKIEFYDAEMIFTFWITKPEIVERLLPPPLKPGAFPVATAFIANYPRTSFGPPYQEAALFLLAEYEGVPGSYCLSMPVTGDMAMAAGREHFGFPKKMAQHISIEKEDEAYHGVVERFEARFFELSFTPDEQAVDSNFRALIETSMGFKGEQGSGTYLFKYFRAPDENLFDYPPRLIRQHTVFRPKTVEWGQTQVTLRPSDCDPWYEVEVVAPLGGMRVVGDNTMLGGKVLAEVDPQAFLPYSFKKWDW